MISAENLTKLKSFSGVSFSFEKGIMCVVSPTDSDKIALLSVLSGEKLATDGSLTKDLNCVGYVAKGAPIPKNLKVSEYVRFVMSARKTPSLPDELKEKLGESFGRSVSALSAIQRYKAAIIAELISEPDALLLERPSFSLTFEEADELFAFIEEIAEETPVIFTSERVSEARKYSDTALVLLNGKQLFFGTAEELIAETDKEGALTVKVKGDEETVKAVFEKYGSEISQSTRKGTYKCVMTVPESEKAEIKKAVALSGLALLEMKAEGDDLKLLIQSLTEKEEALRIAYEEEKSEKEIKTLNQLKGGALSFNHESDDPYDQDEDEDGETEEEAQKKPVSTLSEEEKERKRRALFGHTADDDDENDGESTLFSGKE